VKKFTLLDKKSDCLNHIVVEGVVVLVKSRMFKAAKLPNDSPSLYENICPPPPPPRRWTEIKEFDVLFIEHKRVRGGKKQYLVRCAREDGTPFRQSRWLNVEDLNCPEKIREYKQLRDSPATEEREFERIEQVMRAAAANQKVE
jgi:hypothetical protein